MSAALAIIDPSEGITCAEEALAQLGFALRIERGPVVLEDLQRRHKARLITWASQELSILRIEMEMENCDECGGTGDVWDAQYHPSDPSAAAPCEGCACRERMIEEIREEIQADRERWEEENA